MQLFKRTKFRIEKGFIYLALLGVLCVPRESYAFQDQEWRLDEMNIERLHELLLEHNLLRKGRQFSIDAFRLFKSDYNPAEKNFDREVLVARLRTLFEQEGIDGARRFVRAALADREISNEWERTLLLEAAYKISEKPTSADANLFNFSIEAVADDTGLNDGYLMAVLAAALSRATNSKDIYSARLNDIEQSNPAFAPLNWYYALLSPEEYFRHLEKQKISGNAQAMEAMLDTFALADASAELSEIERVTREAGLSAIPSLQEAFEELRWARLSDLRRRGDSRVSDSILASARLGQKSLSDLLDMVTDSAGGGSISARALRDRNLGLAEKATEAELDRLKTVMAAVNLGNDDLFFVLAEMLSQRRPEAAAELFTKRFDDSSLLGTYESALNDLARKSLGAEVEFDSLVEQPFANYFIISLAEQDAGKFFQDRYYANLQKQAELTGEEWTEYIALTRMRLAEAKDPAELLVIYEREPHLRDELIDLYLEQLLAKTDALTTARRIVADERLTEAKRNALYETLLQTSLSQAKDAAEVRKMYSEELHLSADILDLYISQFLLDENESAVVRKVFLDKRVRAEDLKALVTRWSGEKPSLALAALRNFSAQLDAETMIQVYRNVNAIADKLTPDERQEIPVIFAAIVDSETLFQLASLETILFLHSELSREHSARLDSFYLRALQNLKPTEENLELRNRGARHLLKRASNVESLQPLIDLLNHPDRPLGDRNEDMVFMQFKRVAPEEAVNFIRGELDKWLRMDLAKVPREFLERLRRDVSFALTVADAEILRKIEQIALNLVVKKISIATILDPVKHQLFLTKLKDPEVDRAEIFASSILSAVAVSHRGDSSIPQPLLSDYVQEIELLTSSSNSGRKAVPSVESAIDLYRKTGDAPEAFPLLLATKSSRVEPIVLNAVTEDSVASLTLLGKYFDRLLLSSSSSLKDRIGSHIDYYTSNHIRALVGEAARAGTASVQGRANREAFFLAVEELHKGMQRFCENAGLYSELYEFVCLKASLGDVAARTMEHYNAFSEADRLRISLATNAFTAATERIHSERVRDTGAMLCSISGLGPFIESSNNYVTDDPTQFREIDVINLGFWEILERIEGATISAGDSIYQAVQSQCPGLLESNQLAKESPRKIRLLGGKASEDVRGAD